MSDNWVVQNLQNALDTWNSKLSEIWQLLTTSPQEFKGGTIWNVMVNINGPVLLACFYEAVIIRHDRIIINLLDFCCLCL